MKAKFINASRNTLEGDSFRTPSLSPTVELETTPGTASGSIRPVRSTPVNGWQIDAIASVARSEDSRQHNALAELEPLLRERRIDEVLRLSEGREVLRLSDRLAVQPGALLIYGQSAHSDASLPELPTLLSGIRARRHWRFADADEAHARLTAQTAFRAVCDKEMAAHSSALQDALGLADAFALRVRVGSETMLVTSSDLGHETASSPSAAAWWDALAASDGMRLPDGAVAMTWGKSSGVTRWANTDSLILAIYDAANAGRLVRALNRSRDG